MFNQSSERITENLTEGTTDHAKAIHQTTGTPFKVGVISASDRGGSAQKAFLHVDGQAIKDPKHDQGIFQGKFANRTAIGMEGVAELVADLKPNQALTLGVFEHDEIQTVITDKARQSLKEMPEKTITRSLKYLKFRENEPCILLFDRDLEPGSAESLDGDGLRALMAQVIPGFENVGFVETQSSSSNIYDRTTGECLRGPGNFHILAAAAGDVERAKEAAKIKLWAAGDGFFKFGTPHKITGRSAILERFPIDMSVFSPERLVYEAGPKLPDLLEWRPGKPLFKEGSILDLDAIVASDEEIALAKTNRANARKPWEDKRLSDTAAKVRSAQPDLSESEAKKEARRLIKNDESGILAPDFELFFQDGRTIKAGDLDESHMQCGLQDPLEPDYRNWSYCAKVIPLKDGSIGVSSFAHGTCKKYSIEGAVRRNNAHDSTGNSDSSVVFKSDGLLFKINDKGNPQLYSDSAIADILAKRWKDTIAYNLTTASYYAYGATSDGLWVEEHELMMRARIQGEIRKTGIGYSAHLISSILKLLTSNLAVRKWIEPRDLIPLRNGVLNPATGQLSPHKPENRFTWQLPYDHDPKATCEPIIEWLTQTQDGDLQCVQLLRAYLKAVVTGAAYLQRFLELLGPGGTGKTTFANLAIALVGPQNCYVTSIAELETSRFATAALYGKKLVYIVDADGYNKTLSKFKSLTGQDVLPYERKHKDACEGFIYRGMVIFAANKPLASSDNSSGLGRRRLTVPFMNQIPLGKQRVLLECADNGMFGEFVEHLPGLLNWALAMPDSDMFELVKNTALSVPSLAQAKNDVLLSSNALAAWLDECAIFSPDSRTQIGTATKQQVSKDLGDTRIMISEYQNTDKWLYANYRAYCERAGHSKPVTMRKFSDELLELCRNQLKNNDVKKDRGRDGAVMVGLVLRGESDYNSPCPISGGFSKNEKPTPEQVWASIEPSLQEDVSKMVTEIISYTAQDDRQFLASLTEWHKRHSEKPEWENLRGETWRYITSSSDGRAIARRLQQLSA